MSPLSDFLLKSSSYSSLIGSTTVASHPLAEKYSQSQKKYGLLLFLANKVTTNWHFMAGVILVLEEAANVRCLDLWML